MLSNRERESAPTPAITALNKDHLEGLKASIAKLEKGGIVGTALKHRTTTALSFALII